jgi:hypothetical protein
MSENEEPDDGSGEKAAVIDDIHPPHQAAHSWRDIFIHLATITVGLFIALSLEGCVEWQHHRHLVHEARANIRTEIQDNQKALHDALDRIHKAQADIKADIGALEILKKNPDATGLSISLSLVTSDLQSASWDTARETGALAFMSYPEVKRYASVYSTQTFFTNQTTRVLNAYAGGAAIFPMFDVDNKAAAEVKERDIDSALQSVLAARAELTLYDSIATSLDHDYGEALQQQF